jgi:sugar (pentulose or hexulose) kinase
LPRIIDQYEPVGHLSAALTVAADLHPAQRPLIFPTSDDQQAGLVGGGAVEPGEMAIVLGNSAVVNSSSDRPPATNDLDCMKLNWGRFLWMRCYNNGAQFLDKLVGKDPPWDKLEKEGRAVPAGCEGVNVLPFSEPEPSLRIAEPIDDWQPKKPTKRGVKFRAALEAIAYLIALGVRAHQQAGQNITRISVSGGIARSRLMLDILATVLNREVHKVKSDEGPALGAAVSALAALETHLRRQKGNTAPFTVADAVACMVEFEPEPIRPCDEWKETYRKGLQQFEERLARVKSEKGQSPRSEEVP